MTKKNRTAHGRPVFEYRNQYGCFRANVIFIVDTYDTGSPLIKLIDIDTGKLFTTVSVRYTERELGPNETLIKNWADNEGMARFIVRNQIGMIDGNFRDNYLTWYMNILEMDYIDPGNKHVRKIIEQRQSVDKAAN